MRGARLCDKAMVGTKRYRREENAPEVSLAVSGLPDAVDAVRRLLPPAARPHAKEQELLFSRRRLV